MDPILEGVVRAVQLILAADPQVIRITALSLAVSGSATLLSCLWSLPISLGLAFGTFRGKGIARGTFNALLAVPTVALGLIFYLLLSRTGPLGYFQLLYTPFAITIGQAVLVTPIVVSFATSALESVDQDIGSLARTLGASNLQTYAVVVREASWGIVLASIAAFNRAFAELGIAMMLGGNIRNVTRVLTTAIALETSRGDIALSIALSIILLSISLALSMAINLLRKPSS